MKTRNQIKGALREIIRPYLDEPSLLADADDDTELVAHLNLNSMHLIDVVIDMEDVLGVEIDDHDLDGLRRLGDVVDLVYSKLQAAENLPGQEVPQQSEQKTSVAVRSEDAAANG